MVSMIIFKGVSKLSNVLMVLKSGSNEGGEVMESFDGILSL